MVPRCSKTYKGGGKKLHAYAVAIENILVINMHIVGCLPVIIYLLVSQIQAVMTGNVDVAHTAVTIWYLLYQLRTHTGESRVYVMLAYWTYVVRGKRHMSLNTGPRVARYWPFIWTNCDSNTSILPAPMGCNKVVLSHITLWTSWDYSQFFNLFTLCK